MSLPTDPALKPVYKITCPKCHTDTLYSLLRMLTALKVNCRSCYESINVIDHYRRTELEELAEKLGIPGNFIGANDSAYLKSKETRDTQDTMPL
jgi:predicted xylose isomerase-like sugar epimerase